MNKRPCENSKFSTLELFLEKYTQHSYKDDACSFMLDFELLKLVQ